MRSKLVVTAAAALSLGLMAAPASAAGHAPGKAIKDACHYSFGQLVSAGKSSGDAAHGNYAGGANAFADPYVLMVHGCGH